MAAIVDETKKYLRNVYKWCNQECSDEDKQKGFQINADKVKKFFAATEAEEYLSLGKEDITSLLMNGFEGYENMNIWKLVDIITDKYEYGLERFKKDMNHFYKKEESMSKVTYRDLKKAIDQMTEKQLDYSVTIHDKVMDESFGITELSTSEKLDIVDVIDPADTLVLVIDTLYEPVNEG